MKEYYYKGNKIIESNGVFTAFVLNADQDIDTYEAHSLDGAKRAIDKFDKNSH